MAFSSFYDQMESNKRKTWLLFIAFFFIIFLAGSFFGLYLGSLEAGWLITFIVAAIYFFIAYSSGASMVLAMAGASPAKKEEYPYLINAVEGLAIASGIPAPQAYVINDPSPNAFATGRDPKHSYVAVTTGLLQTMNRQELEGVLAHEMSHIKNYDIRVSLYAIVLVGVISLLANIFLRSIFYSSRGSGGRGSSRKDGGGGAILIIIGIIFMVLAPIAAQLVRMAVSRQREYLADANGAMLTRNPGGLASALEKIGKDPNKLQRADDTTAQLYISDPLKGKLFSLFSTHPPIEERVKRLRSM